MPRCAGRTRSSRPPRPQSLSSITDKMADFFGAYAADLPVAYKAPPPREPGRLTLWGEGGAIWTGGDPVAQAFCLNDFTTVGFGATDGSSFESDALFEPVQFPAFSI